MAIKVGRMVEEGHFEKVVACHERRAEEVRREVARQLAEGRCRVVSSERGADETKGAERP